MGLESQARAGQEGGVVVDEPDIARCPRCKDVINAAVPVDPADREKGPILPRPGDVTVCLNCAAPLLVDRGGRRREMTTVDFSRMSVEDRVKIRIATRDVYRKKIEGDRA